MNRIISEDLKPCPFLDVKKDIGHHPYVQQNSTDLPWVQCTCGAAGPIMATESQAIEAWNTRPPATTLDLTGVTIYHANVQMCDGRRSGEVVFVADLATLQSAGQVGVEALKIARSYVQRNQNGFGTGEDGSQIGSKKVLEIIDGALRATHLHTVPQPVHGVPTIEELVSVIEGSSGFVHQTDVHKLATKIHTMLLNRHEGRS